MALAFYAIQSLMCRKSLPTEACGACNSCAQIARAVHPDVDFLFPSSGATQSSGDDAHALAQWRGFISQGLYQSFEDWNTYVQASSKQLTISAPMVDRLLRHTCLKAVKGSHKSILIWLPELLHPAAANALLKTLEDPPDKTSFILISHRVDKVLPTIRSRAQQRYVRAFSDQEVSHVLNAQGIPTSRRQQITLLASGNLGKALQMTHSACQDPAKNFHAWLRSCYQTKFIDLLAQAEHFHRLEHTVQRAFLRYGLHLLRESVVAQAGCVRLLRVVDTERRFVENFARSVTFKTIAQLIKYVGEAFSHLGKHVNARMVYMTLSLKTTAAIQAMRQS